MIAVSDEWDALQTSGDRIDETQRDFFVLSKESAKVQWNESWEHVARLADHCAQNLIEKHSETTPENGCSIFSKDIRRIRETDARCEVVLIRLENLFLTGMAPARGLAGGVPFAPKHRSTAAQEMTLYA